VKLIFSPKGSVVSASLTILLLCSNQLLAQQDGPAGVPVGSGYVFPSIDLTFLNDDNLTNADINEIDTIGWKVAPSLLYEQSSNRSRFAADWRLDAGWYDDSPIDDYVDNYVSGIFEYQPTNRFNSALKANFTDSHDPRGTGRAEGALVAAQPEFDEWHSFGVEGNFGYGLENGIARVEGDVGYTTKEYDNNRGSTFVRDRDDTYGAARFFYRLAPNTDLVVEGRLADHSYVQTAVGVAPLDSFVHRILGGVSWEATGKTTGSIKLGYIDKDFDSGTRQDGDALIWEIGITWEPRTYSVVNISSSRDFQETNGAGNFIQKDNFISADWTHYWQEHISTTVNFSYTEDTFDPTTREDELTNAGARLNYDLQRWLTVSGGYRYDERDSNANAFDYERNIFELTVRVTL